MVGHMHACMRDKAATGFDSRPPTYVRVYIYGHQLASVHVCSKYVYFVAVLLLEFHQTFCDACIRLSRTFGHLN
jgi:hypothetical protein